MFSNVDKNDINNIMLLCMFLAFLFGSVVYASINSMSMDIGGTVIAQAQEGVFITDVEIIDDMTSDAYNQSSIINETLFGDTITLSPNELKANTTLITYKITVYNSSDFDVAFWNAIYDNDYYSLFYTNQNIIFELKKENNLDDYKTGEILKSKAYVSFYIVFKYKDGKLPDDYLEEYNKLKFYINFEYRKLNIIKYENFETIPEIDKVILGENLELEFGDDISKIEVYMDNKLLILDEEYSFNDGLLKINNVTGNLLLKNIIQYTLIFNSNGGTDCTSKKVDYLNEYGELPIPTKPGYVFAGWYTSLDGGSLIKSDTIYTYNENTTLYAHYGILIPYVNSSSLSGIKVYKDTNISFDTNRNVVKLSVEKMSPDGLDYPFDVGVYLDLPELDVDKNKYIVIGYQVITVFPDSEKTQLYPHVSEFEYDANEKVVAIGNLCKSVDSICTSIFDFSGNAYFAGTITRLRLDYYGTGRDNGANFSGFEEYPFYLYYLSFAESKEEAQVISKLLESMHY